METMLILYALLGLGAVGRDHELRRRDAVPRHELLGEDLAALELGRGLARTEDAQAPVLELVHDPQRERQLGSDDRQIDAELGGEPGQLVDLLGAVRHAVGERPDRSNRSPEPTQRGPVAGCRPAPDCRARSDGRR